MTKLPINQAQLVKLWQQVRSSSEEQSKDFGDVALQYHLAKRFRLIEILDIAAGKRDQGVSVGLVTMLLAIHRNSDPGSKLSFLEWYPNTILPELTGLPVEALGYHDLLSSMDYWTDAAISGAEADMTFKLGIDYHIRLHTLVWDSSSCYFDAQVNELVKFGHSRDHRPDRPQIGTDMFIDTDTGVVPYARSYEGNTVDVSRFPVALDELHRQYPYLEDITILVDRGPVSDDNLTLLRDLGYSVIGGLPAKGQWASMIEDVVTFEVGFNLKGTRWTAQKPFGDVMFCSISFQIGDPNSKYFGKPDNLMDVEKLANGQNRFETNLIPRKNKAAPNLEPPFHSLPSARHCATM